MLPLFSRFVAFCAKLPHRAGRLSSGQEEVPYRPTMLREINSFMISDVPP